MAISIRIMTDADLEAADGILSSAFQRAERWISELRLFRRLQPDGVFLACSDGIPAGMVASIIYSNYAYVGLMGIHQDFQRQGLGFALMKHLLAWMEGQKVPLVKLDASQPGQPLYEKLGFVPLEKVFVMQLQELEREYRRPDEVRVITHPSLDLLSVPDTQAFGADRGRLLHELLNNYPGRAFMLQDPQGNVGGYLFVQDKRIGPWVMTKRVDAEPLLQAALSLPFPGPVSVVVPAENQNSIALLQRYRFKILRTNRHMAYGTVATADHRRSIFAQSSLSLG